VVFSPKEFPQISHKEKYVPQLPQKYLGSFSRIYPSQNQERQEKYDHLLSYSLSSINMYRKGGKKRNHTYNIITIFNYHIFYFKNQQSNFKRDIESEKIDL